MTRSAVDLRTEPHHDTGPTFLTGSRVPGAQLTARLWVPAGRRPETVVLRQVVDGEPVVTPLTRAGEAPGGAWWEGPVRLVNRVNRYRFLLVEPDSADPYAWYHAAGVSDHDVPDATDFQVLAEDAGPDWVRDAVVYQIFPDRFAAHEAPAGRTAPEWAERHSWLDEPPVRGSATGRAWYGGDLEGIADHIGYLKSLGIDTVYLTPVFPARSTHRYDATTFEHVDPLLGGDEALARLSHALHDAGMRLVLDLTTNHTGVTHEWFVRATTAPDSPERRFYSFGRYPDEYAMWLDVPSLPKLDHRSEELRDRLLRGADSVTGRWLLPPVSADGWRTDVANMTGRHGQVDLAHQVAQDMRETMAAIEQSTGADLWLVAEHGHDASRDLEGPGWHGTMNYAGFTRPVWSWLSDPDEDAGLTWLGIPVPIPHLGAGPIVEGVREYTAQMPASSMARSMNLLCSHDTPRIRTVVGTREAQLVAATALFGAPGVPTVFAGDELGATGITGEHARTTIPWSAPEGADPATSRSDEVGPRGGWGAVDRFVLERYRHLSGRRRALAALRHGGMRWVHADGDLVMWLRTHPSGDVLVVLARAAAEAKVPLDLLPASAVEAIEAFDGVDCLVGFTPDGKACLSITADGPGSALVVMQAC